MEQVKELQEEWNPEQFANDEPTEYRDMMMTIAKQFYEMPVEDYREYLKEVDRREREGPSSA